MLDQGALEDLSAFLSDTGLADEPILPRRFASNEFLKQRER
jgi:hypothetical protein